MILEAANNSDNQVNATGSSSKGKSPQSQASSAHNWNAEFRRQLPEVQFQHEIVQQLLDIFISQNKGYKMSVLKQLKSGKISSPTQAQKGEEFAIEVKDNKLYLGVDPLVVPGERAEAPEEGAGTQRRPRLKVMEMQDYLFDVHSILHAIALEVSKNASLIGSVLKHRDQKTFKYIIRNVIALKYLKLQGPDRQIVFREAGDQLDPRVDKFFREMLLDRHTVSQARKAYRVEARRVFIKEITKNMMEHDGLSRGPLDPAQAAVNECSTKLLQNYTSFLLLSNLLMTSEQRPDGDRGLPATLRAVNQSIRRYNQAQKRQLLLRILYEHQLHGAPAPLTGSAQAQRSGGAALADSAIKINFFGQIQRMRDEIQDEKRNLVVVFRPKALSKSIDLLLNIISQFAKSEEVLASIMGSQKKAERGAGGQRTPERRAGGAVGKARHGGEDGRHLRGDRVASPSGSADAKSHGEASGESRQRRAQARRD